MSGTAAIDVVALGHPLVDVLTHESDDVVARAGVERGAMTMVDAARSDEIYAQLGPAQETSGGSAANTTVGVASFGGTRRVHRAHRRRRVRKGVRARSARRGRGVRRRPPRPTGRRPAAAS